jgi:hypothetical protein
LLDESRSDAWISRRNPCVRRPISALGQISADGIPYLTPEIQLFYKSESTQDEGRDRFHGRDATPGQRATTVADERDHRHAWHAPVAESAPVMISCQGQPAGEH